MTQALAALQCAPISSITIKSSQTSSNSKPNNTSNVLRFDVHATTCLSCQHASVDSPNLNSPVSRRNVITLGIVGAVMGFNSSEMKASAAARRPSPPPIEQEKKDPNINGVLAKVLASKKRKEAMKQAMAEQRARGKKVEE